MFWLQSSLNSIFKAIKLVLVPWRKAGASEPAYNLACGPCVLQKNLQQLINLRLPRKHISETREPCNTQFHRTGFLSSLSE